jgi:trehalose synthase
VWRCHVDLSQPDPELWDYLRGFILRYDRVVVSHESYRHASLPVPHSIIAPAIDPLSAKNTVLPESVLDRTLRKFQVPTDKPFICQVSRFDKWKDPVGVVNVFRKVREEVDCRLVLCGSMATDDPEGEAIYERVGRAANDFLETGDIVLVRAENNVLVNALQRRAAVVIQKSLREGFGLTVAEALWKGRPVVASRVGGIPLQIEDGVTGFLVEPDDLDNCAERVMRLLKEPELGEEMGRKGRETVRQKFLITRLLLDYLKLFGKLFDGYGGKS